ncbi:MAG: acyltransferase [Verrucomicrobiota bacterium]|nr:acyltransferase [Verrucomicrobiota bacterium]
MKAPHFFRRVAFDGLIYLCNTIVGRLPSHTLRKAFYRGVMRCAIGEGSYIFSGAQFDTRGGFTLGHDSTINQNCRLDNRGGLAIGDHVSISAEVCILTADHDPRSATFAGRDKPVSIGDYAFIGTRALILPGTKIGRGAVVAAGSVVTKEVAPLSIVAGAPAREIGRRDPTLDYRVGYCRLFA